MIILKLKYLINFYKSKLLKRKCKKLFENKRNIKCSILVVNKKISLDKSFKGDFSLESNKISKKKGLFIYLYWHRETFFPPNFQKKFHYNLQFLELMTN